MLDHYLSGVIGMTFPIVGIGVTAVGLGRKQILLNASMIDQENHGVNMILLAFEEITKSVPINRG